MEYLNETILSLPPSIVSKRQKFRIAFEKHQKKQIEKRNKLEKKLNKYKSAYNDLLIDIETANVELERYERLFKVREFNMMKYISVLAENNRKLESKLYE